MSQVPTVRGPVSAELADAGFMLGMERFGINVETTFEARARPFFERPPAADEQERDGQR